VLASGPLGTPASPGLSGGDGVGSIRSGLGYSELLRSRILSLSLEDQFRVYRISDDVGVTVVFGMDGQRPMDDQRDERGFLAVTVGAGLLFHAEPGPAFTVSATNGPLLRGDESISQVGFGVGLRTEAYPFYQSLSEAVRCDRGTFATYVLSGLHGWALARQDWLGGSGRSYAVGFGIDLGRNLMLPVFGLALDAACS
jgi:hypothetical protein